MTDPYFAPIIESCTSDMPRPEFDRFTLREDGILLFQQPGNTYTRLCVPNGKLPEPLHVFVISDHHDTYTAGHLGTTKTINSVCRYFFWPQMTKDIKDYVRSCDKCQRCKPGNRVYGPHQPLPTPPRRWHTLTIDFAGPFVRSGEGQWDMVLVVVDKFTKRAHFIPTRQSDTAEDTARRFFDGVVRLHGIPSVIVSDRDVKFTSRFWQALFERFGTKLAMSTSYHPQNRWAVGTDGEDSKRYASLSRRSPTARSDSSSCRTRVRI